MRFPGFLKTNMPKFPFDVESVRLQLAGQGRI